MHVVIATFLGREECKSYFEQHVPKEIRNEIRGYVPLVLTEQDLESVGKFPALAV